MTPKATTQRVDQRAGALGLGEFLHAPDMGGALGVEVKRFRVRVLGTTSRTALRGIDMRVPDALGFVW
jgi:hypothetical protein